MKRMMLKLLKALKNPTEPHFFLTIISIWQRVITKKTAPRDTTDRFG